jgi:hypothetical protein
MRGNYTQDVLAGMATDPSPRAVNDRAEIAKAIAAAATERHGLVHAASIRRHLPSSVAPRYVGVVVNTLRCRGVLVSTSRYEPNGDARNGNATKRSPVWRLKRPITPEDLA